MGVIPGSKINSSRFKDNLIELVPGIRAKSTKKRMPVSLIFESDINIGTKAKHVNMMANLIA